MDYSSKFAIGARSVGQRFGVLRPIVRLYRAYFSKSYEERFNKALLNAIRTADVVWDVGANIGLYTQLFAERAKAGCVVAFEPSPRSFAILKKATSDKRNVQLHNVALAEFEGLADFYVNPDDASGVTDSFAKHEGGANLVQVSVSRGDDFALTQVPNVIKIDVEGFELEVLKGLSDTLRSDQLRAVFIEVHFLELARRDLRKAPAELVALLKEGGFSVSWIDPSHIAAERVNTIRR